MPNFPVKVFYPRPNGGTKKLTAKNQQELDGLIRIGWKMQDSTKKGE